MCLSSDVSKLCDLWSISLPLIASPKAYGAKAKFDVLNLSGTVKIVDLLKGGMSLVETGQHRRKNESDNLSTALNSMYSEHPWFFLSHRLLRTICCVYQKSTIISTAMLTYS
jgi:hypothetical protein